jgi:hypothetical protein
MDCPIISKSSFIRGMQCPKSLWLHLNHPENRDEISNQQQQLFSTGHSIGFLAQQLFPGGIDASRGDHSKIFEAVSYTKELIAKGQPVIYEAAFSDGETLCYMDILVKEKDDWVAYEVKASTGVRDYQILDAAFQYFAINRSGLPLKKVSLVHVNNQYVRRGDLEIRQLFTIEQMNDRVIPMQETIPGELLQLQQMLKAGAIPEVSMWRQCTNPFSCDFQGFCTKSCVPDEKGNPDPARRDQEALDEFLAQLEYPLYFMDFETIQFAVPQYDESRPYQQIPFQWSLHLKKTRKSLVEHFEFLGTPPVDPRTAFIQSLLYHVGDKGSVIVWNKTFENTRLKEISRDFPEYSDRIESILERVVDLMVPFRRKHLYTPEMNGSYSLKAVLPALVPDLSYDDQEIQEGGTASMVYESLYSEKDPMIIVKKREDLKKYCALDTLSMIRILEEL